MCRRIISVTCPNNKHAVSFIIGGSVVHETRTTVKAAIARVLPNNLGCLVDDDYWGLLIVNGIVAREYVPRPKNLLGRFSEVVCTAQPDYSLPQKLLQVSMKGGMTMPQRGHLPT